MRLLRFSTAVLWAAAAISGILFLKPPAAKAAAAAVSLCPALSVLRRADCYVFLRSGISGRGPGRRYGGANVIRYFFRVLRLNPVYARNTLFLGLFACALPFLPGQAAMPGMLPIGFAVLSLNTPVCTMLSADPDTDMNVRMLPSQRKHFLAGYCLFIFLINAGLDCVYLISWQIVCGGLVPQDLLTAALFALQSAMFSAALEWRFPLRDWRTETDLWHHPRKYLVPAIMILIAGGIMILKAGIWLWLLLLLRGRRLRAQGRVMRLQREYVRLHMQDMRLRGLLVPVGQLGALPSVRLHERRASDPGEGCGRQAVRIACEERQGRKEGRRVRRVAHGRRSHAQGRGEE